MTIDFIVFAQLRNGECSNRLAWTYRIYRYFHLPSVIPIPTDLTGIFLPGSKLSGILLLRSKISALPLFLAPEMKSGTLATVAIDPTNAISACSF